MSMQKTLGLEVAEGCILAQVVIKGVVFPVFGFSAKTMHNNI